MYVTIVTIIIPFILLVILAGIVAAIVVLLKVIKRYFKNSKLAEERLKLENREIDAIKRRLEKIEGVLEEVE
ncbi:hypothetical protein NIE88_16630 [Sporolactobacillus shoreicorticis]|uniref:DUF4083 domain-containing protein n=1 Tax=Sporolactobacillus shoreicorticis TaxID=1923877 RepID=A0ABW5S4I4_9BACL|nr:hypothetical protein [Sporolactobacillus shoreicorticis]MCO7127395.1 hypothetical protein [Sporolactobacillus shoreicorticis]